MELRVFLVLKHTPCGVWIDRGLGQRRFVLSSARKRFACPTIEEARKSFRARKLRQIKIYEARLKTARTALRLGEEWQAKGETKINF